MNSYTLSITHVIFVFGPPKRQFEESGMGVKRAELTILRFSRNKNNFLEKNMISKVKLDALWSSHATFESRISKTIV